MSRKRFVLPSSRLIVLALAVYVAFPLLAQQGPDSDPDQAVGYVDNIFHHSDIDSINLYNGQLTIPIAIGPSYPVGPKLKFQAMLTYTSRSWEYGNPNATTVNPGNNIPPLTLKFEPLFGDPALGIGWNFNLGAIKPCGPGQGRRCYVSRDGAEHLFNQPVDTSTFKTGNGEQYLLRYKNGSSEAAGYEMWDGDGNHYVFDWLVSGYDDDPGNYIHDFGRGRNGWYLTLLEDPFHNAINVFYYSRTTGSPCPSAWACGSASSPYIPDTSMRCTSTGANVNSWIPQSIQLNSGATTPGATISIGLDSSMMIKTFAFPVPPVVVGDQARSAVWTLNYQAGTSGGLAYCSVPVVELASIDLPLAVAGQTKDQYLFQYALTSDGLLATAVLLTRLTVPTGASVQYEYGDYSFYHGRISALNAGCKPKGPPSTALVIKSSLPQGARTNRPIPNLPIDQCVPAADEDYIDQHAGVLRKTEVIPTVSGQTVTNLTATTNYTQYAFPFGERGDSGSGIGQSQSVTVVVTPPDVDGHVVAKSYLFWAAPKTGNSQTCPGFPCAGDRTAADLREATYDADPNVASVGQPFCGSATNDPPNSYSFCPNHAVRVAFRTYEYDDPTGEFGNRRLKQETTYFGATLADGTCPSCAWHQVSNSNSLNANGVPNTWEGNGRHYNIESHSGILGGDTRSIETKWNPSTSPWFPNLFDYQITTDPTGSLKSYFDYDHSATANGFLRGVETWDDSGSAKIALRDCRYDDGHGNVGSRYTDTFAQAAAPSSTFCSSLNPARASPGNGDVFATTFTYQNGQKLSARAMNGATPAAWLKYDVTRESKTGWITSSRDTAGLRTDYLYDLFGRPTNISPPGEVATSISYPSLIQTIATRNGGTGLSTYVEYDYDGLGRTVRERKLMLGSQYANRFTLYDGRGSAYFQSEWVPDSFSPGSVTPNVAVSCSASTTPYSTNVPSSAPGIYHACFDPFGRPLLVIGAGYTSQTTISRTDSRQTTPTYYSDTTETSTVACLNGTFSRVGSPPTEQCSTGGISSTTKSVKDAFGRTTSVTEPPTMTSPNGHVTSYSYDVLGKLTSVNGGQNRTFTYDRFGFLRSEHSPEIGDITYDSFGSIGNVRQLTQPGPTSHPNTIVTRAFDYAGRLTSLSTDEGRTYLTNTYDEASHGSSSGKLTTSVSTNFALSTPSTVTDSFVYSGIGGRLSSKSTTVAAGASSLQIGEKWLYNSLGLVQNYFHPRAAGATPFVVSTGYQNGLPVLITANGIPVVTSATYQLYGGLASYSTGDGTSHDVTTTIAADPNSLPRPSQISTSGANSAFSTGIFAYDGAGNIRSIGSDLFGYDALSRLSSATLSGPGGGTQGYQYDDYGNLLTRTGSNPLSITVDASSNRINGYFYDSLGNLTNPSPGETISYDALSRAVTATVAGPVTWNYFYNGAGERVLKNSSAGNTYTFRDPGNRIVTEYSQSAAGATTVSSDNVFLGNLLVGSCANVGVSGNGSTPWVYYSSDHLGTPRLLTNDLGGMVETRRTWPFGEDATTAPSGTAQRLRFATMERDSEGQRYYDHARSHSFGLARFISPDQLGGKVEDPQSWSRYAYARNNPLAYVDPDGNAWQVPKAVSETASILFSFIPVAGDVQDAIRATTGYDPITAERLSTTDRVISAVAAVIPFVGGAALAKIVGKETRALNTVEKAETRTGSYTVTFNSGKRYHGKGPETRAKDSAARVSKEHGESVTEVEWKAAESDREAFKAEAKRIQNDSGVSNPDNFNQINSPGKKYLEKDGQPP